MNRNISLIALVILATTMLISAGDFNINYGGTKIFTVATNATTTVVNFTVSELLYSIGNITTDAYFVGDGTYLTGITVDNNSTEISYHNITDIPSCGVNEFLDFDGTTLTCEAVDGITEADFAAAFNSNITNRVSDFNMTDFAAAFNANWTGMEAKVNTTYLSTYNATYEGYGTLNGTTISYHNVTDIPVCAGSDVLTFDGTTLSCTTPSAQPTWTNVAWLNESQTFAEYNEFTKYVNITEGVRLMGDEAVITRNGTENVNMTIDSNGNINFNLG